MSNPKFGTDGIRGVANRELTPLLAFQLGRAAGDELKARGEVGPVLIARDTRRSGTMLGAALAAGFCSAGCEVSAVGVLPTGGVSYLVRTTEFVLGAVISASHNPAPDNGIKLIGTTGRKVAADFEAAIQSRMESGWKNEDSPMGGDIGRIDQTPGQTEPYRRFLLSTVPEGLGGLRVAVDASNGAAYELGSWIFRELGAEVVETGNTPDGMNINAEGGATKPHTIQSLAQQQRSDLGVAYDGDADRAVFSTGSGALINGDRMMAIWSVYWKQQGSLRPASVVGTVMSNSGFETYLREQGIELIRTSVGDKYVAQTLDETGGQIGGEQSGHIIFPEYGPTGDGLITALQLARVLKRSGSSLDALSQAFHNWPQRLVNVQLDRKEGWENDPQVLAASSRVEAQLVGQGRLSLRASGTQPIVRVMVEAQDEALRDQVIDQVVQALLESRGGKIYSDVELTHALGD